MTDRQQWDDHFFKMGTRHGLEAAVVCNHKESARKSKADTWNRPKLSFARDARIS
jgi:hypothetical protein